MDQAQVAPTRRPDSKAGAALYSVLVNLVLIGAKLLVGLLTGSVAILADAAHSFLDLSASIFAYAGIRTAAKPADEDHAGGHAKAENISSLIQMFLLGATCIAIVIESVRRLVVPGTVRVGWYSFAVVLAAVVIDIAVSRVPRNRPAGPRRERRPRSRRAPLRPGPVGVAGGAGRHHPGRYLQFPDCGSSGRDRGRHHHRDHRDRTGAADDTGAARCDARSPDARRDRAHPRERSAAPWVSRAPRPAGGHACPAGRLGARRWEPIARPGPRGRPRGLRADPARVAGGDRRGRPRGAGR